MTEIDPAVLVDAIRETGIALRPGDVLAVRLRSGAHQDEVNGARRYALAVERDTGLKVVFIPGEEFAHSTVNVTVNWSGDADALRTAVEREIKEYRRRNGGHLDFT